MGRTFNRYVFLEILTPFFLGLCVFTFVLLIARILKMVEMVVNRGVPLLDMMKVFSYILPAFLEVTVPMAVLLALLLAFGRLASDNEIVAMKTSGVSLYQMLVPVGWFVGLAFIVTFLIAIWIRPWSNGALRDALYELVKSRATAGFTAKVFNADFPGLVIYAEEIEPGGQTLKGILISDARESDQRNTVIAKIGLLLPNEETKSLTLRLLDGTIYGSNPRQRSIQKTDFTINDVSLNLEELVDTRSAAGNPKTMTLSQLRKRISQLERRNQTAHAEWIELHRKFSIPFACIVFALVGVPLGIQPTRSVRSRGFALSLLLIFLYYIPLTVGQTLAEKGILRPVVGLWLPNAGFLVFGLALFRQTAREAPLLGFERAERFWLDVRERLSRGTDQ